MHLPSKIEINITFNLKILGLLTLSCLLWTKYFLLIKSHKKILDKRKSDKAVVIYSRKRGITGWYKFRTNPYKISFDNITKVFDPLIEFINTSTETLDIAVMIISSFILTDVIINVLKKGVKVRIILNYNHNINNKLVRKIIKNGARVVFFKEQQPNTWSNLFHYKYGVKDYGLKNQAVYCGSLNWTDNACLNNYEDLTISDNEKMIESFYRNFNLAFNYMESSNNKVL